ncbi:MAG: ABC transporter substrate-binding protein [Pseudomonadota bacterium]
MSKFLTALLGLMLAAQAWAQDDPVEMIETATGELFALVESHRNEYPDDQDRLFAGLKGILGERTDSFYSARLVLGRAGRGLETEQIQAFADALTDVLMRRFGGGLLEFQSEDQIDVLPLAGDNSDRLTRVRTRINLNNGDRAPVDYMLRKRDGNWLIFDVIVEGISYVATFRNQFAEEIRRNGFDATLARLQSGEIEVDVDGISE